MQSGGRGRRESCADPVATYRSQFRIGGVSVRVVGQDNDDVILVPSLEPFRTVTLISDINIQIEWTDKFDPAAGRQLFDSNSVWRLYGDGRTSSSTSAPQFWERSRISGCRWTVNSAPPDSR